MKLIRAFVTVAASLSLAACSSIGTINGVSLDSSKKMGATSSSSDTWCDQNDQQRWTCILLAAGAVGGMAAILASKDHKNSAPPAPPAPPDRG